jgi:glycosyltransferase involved in cell wall biosynthesis
MKILISAMACNPYLGSENYFGWSAVRTLAQDHELWVLTGARNEPDFQKAQREGLLPGNVRFVYAGKFKPWHSNRMLARLQGWKEYLYFSKDIERRAFELHEAISFDLAHHVTFSSWRVPSPLWKLGIPFVFGPIGGNEQFPVRFFSVLGSMARAFEMFRMITNLTSRFSPAVRRCIRNAAHVFTANPETEELVRCLRGTANGVSQLSPGFFSCAQIKTLQERLSLKEVTGPLRLFAGGNLEGRKGVALALRALAIAKQNGVKFRYRLGGVGPESDNLQQLARRLGLHEEVIFGDALSGEAYRDELAASHIFLLPSFRESAGLTMMEAMLAGCLPIVADCGGPGYIVTPDCGIKLPVESPEKMVRKIAKTLTNLNQNRPEILKKGQAASIRIASTFSDCDYAAKINSVYKELAGAKTV